VCLAAAPIVGGQALVWQCPLGSKADNCAAKRHVRLTTKADIQRCEKKTESVMPLTLDRAAVTNVHPVAIKP